MIKRSTFWGCGFGLALTLLPATALAEGVLLAPSRLNKDVRSAIEREVARAKGSEPETFARLRSLRGHRPEVYRQFRSQEPSVFLELQALGPGGGWALIEAIALRAPERGAATQREWDAVREGLLLALAEREMPEASPVLQQVFANADADWVALRGAAVGLGRLGGDKERAILIDALRQGGMRRDAALWGLRFVRDMGVVNAVAPLLVGPPEATAKLASRALGYVGSSWAWRTGRVGRADLELPVRGKCAEVLLEAYVRHGDAVREQIAQSLSMVEHPDTLRMVEQKLSSAVSEEERRGWRVLKRRLEASR